jgi:hypothetical protein
MEAVIAQNWVTAVAKAAGDIAVGGEDKPPGAANHAGARGNFLANQPGDLL